MELSELVRNDVEVAPAFERLAILSLTEDSRTVEPGALFAAIPGTERDGADFVEMALAKGAIAVLAHPDIARHKAGAAIARRANVALLLSPNPRQALARIAARFYAPQPECILAVTGTNGKSSVAAFTREILSAAGRPAASMGTLGAIADGITLPLQHTTPDPVTLHRTLAELKRHGIDHVALEASSHGLAQCRLDGLAIRAGAFLNLTRDHLDYHPTVDDYLSAKLRLFSDLLPCGGTAVINADMDVFPTVRAVAEARRHRVLTVGRAGEALRLLKQVPTPHGQIIRLGGSLVGGEIEMSLSLYGDFQAANVLAAAGLAIGAGLEWREISIRLPGLAGVPGRLEQIGRTPKGGLVFVDYAHTPDALERVLLALRPHTNGRLVCVFGCGGNRDKGKRPLMGAIAGRLADLAIVTDDNPRKEDAGAIRREVLEGLSGARAEVREIGDRAAAIAAGCGALEAGDVLVVAGKGHETGQIVGDRVLPFSDREVALATIRGRGEVA